MKDLPNTDIKSAMKIWPGKPYPLGANWDGAGVNFSLFSENATKVELCLFDGADAKRETRIPLREQTHQIWHVYLPEARPGQFYGYRVHGPYEPQQGQRFNPAKLLLDPYAKAIHGTVQWSDALFGYSIGDPKEDLSRSDEDSASGLPKCVVVDPAFSWGNDAPPATPWHETIIYELHVRGFTMRHPGVPPELRGTYTALTLPPVIDYLKGLGITAVELLPVHQYIADKHLRERGLTNYWGYNSIGYFAPEASYARAGTVGQQVSEFKSMVRALHREGIEVILDVVYNHTGEGNQMGPTLCFRGLDNVSYYRVVETDRRYYMDYTGCGNTLDMTHPRVLQMIMDSLRYWVEEMHVDGFRFDLASTLARELHDVDRLGAFFDIIQQDPVISQVKLIAEPWDLGPGGYQVGNFPVLWAEWNAAYRDTARRFWKGDAGQVGDLGYRLTGSSDLYSHNGRQPYASVNFITAHDGFTLHDLVSYNEKHNEANGEENRDGHNENLSWNSGAEGDTDDAGILALRERQKRNFLATLFLAQGVPMLLAGDELGRTQGGNNNAYCQVNEISWLDWKLDRPRRELLEFARFLIRLRDEHPVLRRRHFFQGRRIRGSEVKDLAWFRPDGKEMSDEDWSNSEARCFGLRLAGDAIEELDDRGNRLVDDTLLILLNAYHEPMRFTLPAHRRKVRWEVVLDTHEPPSIQRKKRFMRGGEVYEVKDRSLAVLRLPNGAEGEEKNGNSRSALRSSRREAASRPLP